jgi:hypothetical protein
VVLDGPFVFVLGEREGAELGVRTLAPCVRTPSILSAGTETKSLPTLIPYSRHDWLELVSRRGAPMPGTWFEESEDSSPFYAALFERFVKGSLSSSPPHAAVRRRGVSQRGMA